ncbi:lipopolysaccharide biosynthesis protein [Streptomyces sp. NPDC048290]|uniref:lipopolysaccharide biosynthesis protein n=1 Tax=Streptomyces sp. NPDC048290 TaxID=3155811 RepID=UPI00344A07A1
MKSDRSPRAQRPAFRVLARTKGLPPWSLLAAGVVAGGLIGGGYGALSTPVYSATSYVVAVPTERSDSAAALGFAQAYGRVADQLAVLADAQVWAGVPVRTLQNSVTTATSPDAPMVAVTATSHRPDLAADMANAVAKALTGHASDSEDATHVELQQFARAVKPAAPSSAGPELTGLVGASAGGLLGGLALLVRPRRATGGDGSGAGRDGGGEGGGGRTATAVPGPAVAADASGRL